MALIVAPGVAATRSELVIQSQGLLTLFNRSLTRMAARSRTVGRQAAPHRFESQQQKTDRYREVVVRWTPGGEIVEASEIKNGKKRPSEVPSTEQVDTVDPLTALLRLRAWIADPATPRNALTRERVFDGRRRFDIEVHRLPDGVDEHGTAVHRVEARILPVFGLDENDTYASWPDRPARWFEVLIAADGSYAPLAVRENGAALIELTRDCVREPGCHAPSPPG